MRKFKNTEYLQNASLKNFCTFKIGGNAKHLFIAKNTKSIKKICRYCMKNNIKFKVIGLGANLVFDDAGFDGCIIVNRSNSIKFNHSSVIVDSGISVGNLITRCYTRGLSGLESLAGIPSTVGGAIVNNLGAYNCEFSSVVESVTGFKLDDKLTKIKLSNADCFFSYRDSIFKRENYVITKVKLNLKEMDKSLILKSIQRAIEKKRSSQPLNFPSAGSVFKRCEITPAKVIDELGLKGLRINDAQISQKHAGFIINLGSATSEDVKTLTNIIKNRVKNEHDVDPPLEIEFVE